MSRFIDMMISQNSGTTGFPNTVVGTTPQLAGVLGLRTQGIAGGGGLSGLAVNLGGTVGVSADIDVIATVIINVQRGSATFGAGTIIYTAAHRLGLAVLDTQVISINAVDVSAPAAAETIYALFVSATTLLGAVTRTGPESFHAIGVDLSANTP